MVSITLVDEVSLIAFWLCFTRWVTILFQIPLFDESGVPGIVKVVTSVLISFAFFPYLKPVIMQDIAFAGVENLWFLTMYQAITGLAIGYFVRAIMSIYVSAGALMSQQMGFAAVQYFDPTVGQQVGPLEKIIRWTVVVLILTSGALLPMFKGIFASFDSINLMNLSKLGDSPQYMTKLFIGVFKSAILLAGPLIFTNVLVTAIMGIIARMVPQMNILMVSFVVNIGMGLFVLITISHEFFHVAYKQYVSFLGDWFLYLQ